MATRFYKLLVAVALVATCTFGLAASQAQAQIGSVRISKPNPPKITKPKIPEKIRQPTFPTSPGPIKLPGAKGALDKFKSGTRKPTNPFSGNPFGPHGPVKIKLKDPRLDRHIPKELKPTQGGGDLGEGGNSGEGGRTETGELEKAIIRFKKLPF